MDTLGTPSLDLAFVIGWYAGWAARGREEQAVADARACGVRCMLAAAGA